MAVQPAIRPEILEIHRSMATLYERDPVALIELSWALQHYTGEEDLRAEGMDHGYFETLQKAGLITADGKISEDVADVMDACFMQENGTWTLYDLPPVVQVFYGSGPSGGTEP